ncbi:MAG TPA: DUF2752 domain-containing protein [Pirellulales bacterium]|nr:DUF2752 domain-containing protein [Pirellulales bacterium]
MPRWQRLLLWSLAAGGLVWLWAVDPAESHVYPRCLLHELTGLNCPGCGSTRAVHALLHGDLAGALGYNALFTLVLPLAGGWVTWHWLHAGRTRWPAASGRWLLVVLLAFGLARNIPCHPFNMLAPRAGAGQEKTPAIDTTDAGERAGTAR